MEQCPICHAQLNGADLCRRCRAELGKVKQIKKRGETLAAAALHFLSLGQQARAVRLLRRANALHSSPEIAWILDKIQAQESAGARRLEQGSNGDTEVEQSVSQDRLDRSEPCR
jgi:hypothetical protein